MGHSVETLPDNVEDLIISRHVEAWEVLGADYNAFLHHLRIPNITDALVSRYCNLLVRCAGEPVGVDQWLVGGVCGRNGDVATR